MTAVTVGVIPHITFDSGMLRIRLRLSMAIRAHEHRVIRRIRMTISTLCGLVW